MTAFRLARHPAPSPSWSELVHRAARRLEAAGVASPRHDAEELAASVLGTVRSRLALYLRDPAGEARRARYERLVERRCERIPLQLITGEAGFRGLAVGIEAGVFIPRPETETLVEVVLRHLGAGPSSREARILDIGTGSGAVAVAIGAEAPGCRVWATDVSSEALECASRNARRAGLSGRVSFIRADLVSPLGERADSYFDAVVSNPPYVPTGDIDALQPEVKDHDPRAALDGGSDGLSVVERIVEEAPRLLAPGGLLAIELGDGQAEVVASDRRLLAGIEKHGMQLLDPVPDTTGRLRVFRAVKLPVDGGARR